MLNHPGRYKMNIYKKLIEVRKSVPYLQKTATGPQFNYVGSSQVLGTLKAKMDELNLLLIPKVIGHTLHESTIEFMDGNKPKRTTTYFTELEMEYTWLNADNPEEKIVCTWYGQGVDIAGEKGVGKAMTYGEKYFMLKFFNIPTDKDDPDSFQEKFEDKTISKNNIIELQELAKNADISEQDMIKGIMKKYQKSSLKQLTVSEYETIRESIKKKIDVSNPAVDDNQIDEEQRKLDEIIERNNRKCAEILD
jgi:hypothetical protein